MTNGPWWAEAAGSRCLDPIKRISSGPVFYVFPQRYCLFFQNWTPKSSSLTLFNNLNRSTQIFKRLMWPKPPPPKKKDLWIECKIPLLFFYYYSQRKAFSRENGYDSWLHRHSGLNLPDLAIVLDTSGELKSGHGHLDSAQLRLTEPFSLCPC